MPGLITEAHTRTTTAKDDRRTIRICGGLESNKLLRLQRLSTLVKAFMQYRADLGMCTCPDLDHDR
jgi:hypothetical protein